MGNHFCSFEDFNEKRKMKDLANHMVIYISKNSNGFEEMFSLAILAKK